METGQTGAKAQRCRRLQVILRLGQKQDPWGGTQAWQFCKLPGDSTVQPREPQERRVRQRGAVIPHFAGGETDAKGMRSLIQGQPESSKAGT